MKKSALGMVCLLMLAVIWAQLNRVASIRRVQPWLMEAAPPSADVPSIDWKVYGQWLIRRRAFNQVWVTRGQRDIVDDLVPYLKDSSADLRASAVRALGILENPKGEKVLEEMLDKGGKDGKPENFNTADILSIRVALTRLQSRDWRIEDRVSAITTVFGLSKNDLISLSQRINDPNHPLKRADGNRILNEVADLIYADRLKRKSTDGLERTITWSPDQQAKIACASLAPAQQAGVIIDQLMKKTVVNDDSHLVELLVGLGNPGATAIQSKLKEIATRPKDFGRLEPVTGHKRYFIKRIGYVLLFEAAASLGEPENAALLKNISQSADADLELSYYATQSYQRAQRQSGTQPQFGPAAVVSLP